MGFRKELADARHVAMVTTIRNGEHWGFRRRIQYTVIGNQHAIKMAVIQIQIKLLEMFVL